MQLLYKKKTLYVYWVQIKGYKFVNRVTVGLCHFGNSKRHLQETSHNCNNNSCIPTNQMLSLLLRLSPSYSGSLPPCTNTCLVVHTCHCHKLNGLIILLRLPFGVKFWKGKSRYMRTGQVIINPFSCSLIPDLVRYEINQWDVPPFGNGTGFFSACITPQCVLSNDCLHETTLHVLILK